jgi:hypothetical protein
LNDQFDNKTLQEVGIQSDSNLFTLYRTPGGMEWKLKIRDIDGNILSVQIDSTKSVQCLKKLISTKSRKISVDNMGLKLGTKYLLNEQLIKHVPGLCSGSTLD